METDGVWGIRRESVREGYHGSVAALANVAVTFPMNKIIFRQQTLNLPVKEAVRSIVRDGPALFYRGVAPPLMQQLLSKSIMFGMYHHFGEVYSSLLGVTSEYNSKRWQSRTDLLVGSLAAGSSATMELLLLPFERIQSLLQLPEYHHRYRHVFHAFRRLYHDGHGDVREYFRGFATCLARNVIGSVLFFGCRGHVNDLFDEGLASNFASGALLGAGCGAVTYPLNVAKNVMQSRVGGEYQGLFTVTKRLVVERGGFHVLYRGLQLNIFRSLISWGIINSVMMHYSRSLPDPTDDDGTYDPE